MLFWLSLSCSQVCRIEWPLSQVFALDLLLPATGYFVLAVAVVVVVVLCNATCSSWEWMKVLCCAHNISSHIFVFCRHFILPTHTHRHTHTQCPFCFVFIISNYSVCSALDSSFFCLSSPFFFRFYWTARSLFDFCQRYFRFISAPFVSLFPLSFCADVVAFLVLSPLLFFV